MFVKTALLSVTGFSEGQLEQKEVCVGVFLDMEVAVDGTLRGIIEKDAVDHRRF